MAHKKAAGSTKNNRDSQPKYLGVKLYDGEAAKIGSILVRQRGSKILPGNGVKMGKDHTLFAVRDGKVKTLSKRHLRYDGRVVVKKVANVV